MKQTYIIEALVMDEHLPRFVRNEYQGWQSAKEGLARFEEAAAQDIKVYEKSEIRMLSGIDLKPFDIWCEGHSVTGGTAGASCIGFSRGITFKDACERHAERNKNFKQYFDADKMTFWGCRLFDNETEARKLFG